MSNLSHRLLARTLPSAIKRVLPDAEGRSYGFELFLQQKLKGTYWWTLSYNYGHSDTRLNESNPWLTHSLGQPA